MKGIISNAYGVVLRDSLEHPQSDVTVSLRFEFLAAFL